MEHALRLLSLGHSVGRLTGPPMILVISLYAYFSENSLSQMTVLDCLLLTSWTFILVFTVQHIISISFLLMQHVHFIYGYFKNNFTALKYRLDLALDSLDSFKKKKKKEDLPSFGGFYANSQAYSCLESFINVILPFTARSSSGLLCSLSLCNGHH